MSTLIRVQALVRGFLERRRYRVRKLSAEVTSKYFKHDEAKETLTGMFKDSKSVRNAKHTYSTKAVYNG